MSRFDELVPEHVRALSAYVPGKPVRAAERESGVRCVKLASNENPFGPSPLAVEAMARAAAGSNFYPDNDNLELRLRLAQRAGLAPENVLVTPGSTGFLDIIARTLLRPGLKAVTSERTFIVYAMVVRAAGGTLVQAPMRGHGFDLDAIARSIDSHTRVVFLANPNNPTGTMFDAAAMDAFLERVPAHVLVVLDEAYSDFADDYAARHRRRWSRSLEYVREGRQIVVLRSRRRMAWRARGWATDTRPSRSCSTSRGCGRRLPSRTCRRPRRWRPWKTPSTFAARWRTTWQALHGSSRGFANWDCNRRRPRPTSSTSKCLDPAPQWPSVSRRRA